MDSTHKWGLYLLLISIAALLYLPFNHQMELVHEEPRRVVIAQNMIESKDFFRPQMNGTLYFAKPPLQNWIIAATAGPLSPMTEFSVRVNTWIVAMILMLCVLVGTRRYLSLPVQFFLGCSIFLSPHIASKIILAEIEIAFVLLVTLNIWVWWLKYYRGDRGLKLWVWPSIILGLSFLAKREPAILFYYLPVCATLFLWKRDFKTFFSWGHFFGLGVFSLFLLAWPLPLIFEAGLERFLHDMNQEVLSRGGGFDILGHITHFITYPLEVWAAQMPFSAALLLFALPKVRQKAREMFSEHMIFAMVAIGVNFTPYLLKTDIATRYFMPMHPSFLILSAFALEAARRAYTSKNLNKATIIFYAIGIPFLLIGTLLFCANLLIALEGMQLKVIPFSFTENFGKAWINPYLALILSIAALSSVIILHFSRQKLADKYQMNVPLFFLVFALTFGGFAWRMSEIQALLPQKSMKLDAREQIWPAIDRMHETVRDANGVVYIPTGLEAKLWFYDRHNIFKIKSLDSIIEEALDEIGSGIKTVWILYLIPQNHFEKQLETYVEKLNKKEIEMNYFVEFDSPHRNYSYRFLRIEIKKASSPTLR